MDPNATLKEIRELVEVMGNDSFEPCLVKLVSKLDGWMSGGGRLPDDWQMKR